MLPYRFRGPPEHAHLGAVLADDLVDALSRTEGLLVLSTGATAAHADTRDPRAIGRDLGATLVVEGSVRLTEGRVVVTSRVLDASTGVQRFVADQEGAIAEVLSLQEATALRVAESLRLPLVARRITAEVPGDAMGEYLTARGQLAARDGPGADRAVLGFERALAIAPDFPPAVAGHAVASVQRWFRGFGRDEEQTRGEVERSVARAMAVAPHLAESHLAAATFAMQEGRMPDGVRHLERALGIAPTYAEALETLGMLELEIGSTEAALRHLRLAQTIDPARAYAAVADVRLIVLDGATADPWEAVRETTDRLGPRRFMVLGQRIRAAGWLGHRAALEECLAWAREDRHAPLVAVCQGMLGQIDPAREYFERVLSLTRNARTRALVGQLLTEALVVARDLPAAEAALERAADEALVDLDWLRRCPLIAPLRGHIPFDRALRKVQDRVGAMQLSSRS